MPLTDREALIANYFYQYFTLHGGIPTKELAANTVKITESEYDKCLANNDFAVNLRVRGVRLPGRDLPLSDDDDTVGLGSLGVGAVTDRQLLGLDAYFDRVDRRSFPKKLADLQIRTEEWNTWLADPTFANYMAQRAEKILGGSQAEAHMSLIDQVKSGNFKAIEYFNRISGYYDPNANQIDANALLMSVIEIIMKHVKDPAVLEAVSTDMIALGKQHGAIKASPTGVIGASPVITTLQLEAL